LLGEYVVLGVRVVAEPGPQLDHQLAGCASGRVDEEGRPNCCS
jgi:hypothetical protein